MSERLSGKYLKIIFYIGLCFCSLAPKTKAASPSNVPPAPIDFCSPTLKKAPFYQVYNSCAQLSLGKTLHRIKNPDHGTKPVGYCSGCNTPAQAPQVLKEICKDPADYVCENGSGKVFSGQCDLQLLETTEAAQVPPYIDARCRVQKKMRVFLNSKKAMCPPKITSAACDQLLKTKFPEQITTLLHAEIYTPQRIARIQAAFKRVKAMQIRIIKNSGLIPVKYKKIILAKIQAAQVNLSTSSKDAAACSVPGPFGPDTAIYYTSKGKMKGKIEFCIGAMAQIDFLNEVELLHSLSDELAHSFGPCSMESDTDLVSGRKKGKPILAFDVFPGLFKCLHGGGGIDGCNRAVVFCNNPRGIRQGCSGATDQSKCISEAKRKPSCSFGPADPTYQGNNLADYRKGIDPINQINEAFSDYMGAEVVGKIIADDIRRGQMSITDRANGLLALASDNVRLHGLCLKKNTFDEHPTGTLRINRIIMGSKTFREAICGKGQAPPNTEGAGVTCQGI